MTDAHRRNDANKDKEIHVSQWPIDLIIDIQYPLGGYAVRELKRHLLQAKRFLARKAAQVAKEELLAVAKTQLDANAHAPLSASLLAIKDVLPETLDLGNDQFVQGLHELIRSIDYDRTGSISKRKIKDFAANPPQEIRASLAKKMGTMH